MRKTSKQIKELATSLRKKKQDEVRRRPSPTVHIHARPMDEQQEQRLFTAVDALLAEWVRQELGRAKQS